MPYWDNKDIYLLVTHSCAFFNSFMCNILTPQNNQKTLLQICLKTGEWEESTLRS